MITKDSIRTIVRNAAYFASLLLGIQEDEYSIEIIDDPGFELDGAYDIQQKTITINTAQLWKGAVAFTDGIHNVTDDDLKSEAVLAVFHEMRHAYQMKTLHAYNCNQILGSKTYPQHESDKTCEIWTQELKTYVFGSEEVHKTLLEKDAVAFADYLLIRLGLITSVNYTGEDAPLRRKLLGNMKRRYNRIALPVDRPKSCSV